MLRTVSGRLMNVVRGSMNLSAPRIAAIGAIRCSHDGPEETDEQFNARYIAYFNAADGWMARKAMNDIVGMDVVPEPTVIIAGLKACRRANDIALAIRWLEGCRDKAGRDPQIWGYLQQEIQPTCEELGIPTLAECGYEKPELGCKTVFEQ